MRAAAMRFARFGKRAPCESVLGPLNACGEGSHHPSSLSLLFRCFSFTTSVLHFYARVSPCADSASPPRFSHTSSLSFFFFFSPFASRGRIADCSRPALLTAHSLAPHGLHSRDDEWSGHFAKVAFYISFFLFNRVLSSLTNGREGGRTWLF